MWSALVSSFIISLVLELDVIWHKGVLVLVPSVTRHPESPPRWQKFKFTAQHMSWVHRDFVCQSYSLFFAQLSDFFFSPLNDPQFWSKCWGASVFCSSIVLKDCRTTLNCHTTTQSGGWVEIVQHNCNGSIIHMSGSGEAIVHMYS